MLSIRYDVRELVKTASALRVSSTQLRCCCDPPEPIRGGRVCTREQECGATRDATESGACPGYLLETWFSLPGFQQATSGAMGCRADGGWLAPGVERFRPMHYGPTRRRAFRVSPAFCGDQTWTYSHTFAEGAAMVGAEIDIMRLLHTRNATVGRARAPLNVTVLRLRSARATPLTRAALRRPARSSAATCMTDRLRAPRRPSALPRARTQWAVR
jgi:hypothetical protein